MKKVVTINLNGRAYQVEEPGYEALQQYLKQAQKKLARDPDRDEVLADFEQAIADKCNQFMKKQKTVITDVEIDKIIDDMGPVEIPTAEDQDPPAVNIPAGAPRRLFLIREGSMIGGVCTGLGAYFDVDVNVIRLLFIIFTFLTSGEMIPIYLLMMFFLPEATTPEEKAAARGDRYTANDLLERARSKYADLSSKGYWDNMSNAAQPAFARLGYTLARIGRFIAQVTLVLSIIAAACISVAWIATAWSIVATNRIWGYTVDPHFSRLLFGFWDTTLFLVLLLPILSVLLTALWVLHRDRVARLRRWSQYGIGIMWCVSLALFIAIPLTNSTQLQNLVKLNNGTTRKLDLGDKSFCLTKDQNSNIHVRDCTP